MALIDGVFNIYLFNAWFVFNANDCWNVPAAIISATLIQMIRSLEVSQALN